MDEDTEYLKLPVDERCQHKLWKARVSGYEEAKKIFERASDEKSPEFSKYLGLIKKFVTDSNAVAQEKGLDAALAFITNAGCAGKTTGEVISGVVQKCLGAPKTKTREKGHEIILLYVEIEKFEIVQEEIVKGLENKSPKVVAACVHSLTDILKNFGHKVLVLKPLVKLIPKLLEDRDKNVREETKLLTVEIYRWIGAPIKPQLQNLKPVQLTELEKEFEKLGNEKPQQVRYLRSQQDLKLKREALEAGDEAEDENEEEEEEAVAAAIDPYELLDPVDILSKLPKDFYDKCEAKKWQERKEAMETLQQLTSNPKLEPGDYGELVRILKKMIAKDSNIMIVGLAGKCVAGLASGLKKKFQPYAGFFIPVILEKFKEKKPTVLLPMKEASDAVYECTTLDTIMEDLLTALQNKNPSVKAETLAFISRIFSKSTTAILTKKVLKTFCAAILTTLNDADGIVRDNSAVALGTAMKVVSEKAITPFLQDIDNIKMGKIKECCDKAEVIAPKASKAKVVKPAAQKESSKPVPAKSSSPAAAPSQPEVKKTKVVEKKVVRGKGKKKGGASAVAEKTIPTEKELSKEEALEVVDSILPQSVVAGLSSANWKERLASMEKFLEMVQATEDLPTQALIVVLAQKPGLKDTNFQVLNLKFTTLNEIAKKSSSFSQTSANCCIKDVIDKIGDNKAGANAAEALSTIAEVTSLKFICSEAMSYAFSQKNPKNQIEAVNWLSKSIKEFGFTIELKPMITLTKQGLAATNPALRTACVNLISTMYMYMGQTLRTFYEDEKPALLQLIDAECEKVKDSRPPVPTKGVSASAPADDGGAVDNEEECAPAEVNIADLIPRTDFGSQIPSSVITELSDKNWKVRSEALDKLKALLSELKFITPNLGELLTPLKLRLAETNKNLLILFLNFTESLATALGPGTKQHVRLLAPAIFTALGDNKTTVRAAAMSCIQTWTENASFQTFIDGEMLMEAFKPENPLIRSELLGWLIEGLTNAKSVPNAELSMLIPTLYVCIEDRSADVRKKAQEAVLPFMIHLGCETMVRAAGKLKPGSKNIIVGHLEKAKPNLPARPTKTTKASAKKKVVEDDASVPSMKVSPPTKEAGASKRAASKTRKPEPTSKSKKKEEEAEIGPPLQVNGLKDQRMAEEKALKVLKWNFTTPREEFYEQLKDQMSTAGFSRSLQANMFHSDFKYHLKAIEALNECVETCPDALVCNVDLILKWMSLRFFDTNPSVLLKGLEHLQQLFNVLLDSRYHLSDTDASSFIPYLILKVGDPKDPVRKGVREIFKLLCKVYPSNKMFSFLMNGLASKNARQRTECLEELGSLIETYGMSVCQPSAGSALKEIAKQISDRDNNVRNAALNCVVQAYFIERERVYKLVGHLADKDMSLLEERIKRASKNRPVSANIQKPSADTKVIRPPSGRQIQHQQPQPEPEILDTENNIAESEPPVVTRRFSPRSTTSRPMSSGPFTLDLESIEQMVESSDGQSMLSRKASLVKHDLGDVCAPTPLLPKTRSRPPSPAQKVLKMSSDVASTMDLVISQIASNNIKTSLCALSQIDTLLRDAEKAECMVSRVDQLLVAVSLLYRMVYNRYMSDPDTSKYEVIKLYRLLARTISSLLQTNVLAKEASTDVLRDLIYNILTVLVDTRINDLEEGPQMSRTLNVLMGRMLEKCDATNAMSALIKLLQDCVASEACSIKITELVMKCLWKMIRKLPNSIQQLDFDRILYDVHVFLKLFPFAVWKERSIDTPLRTIKTILHSFAKSEGNKILGHMTLIENSKESEVEAYLLKVLKGSKTQTAVNMADMNSPDVVADARNATRREVKTSSRGLSKNSHEVLAEIFKKIGSKENTKEGLSDLYDFKQKYPEADIEPFLRKSSDFFQKYIERGLKTIEQEKNNNTATGNINLTQISSQTSTVTTYSAYSTQTSTSTTSDLPNPSVYMERLKVLRAKCGLDNSKYDRNAEAVKKPSIVPLAQSKSHEDTENISSPISTNMNSNENGLTGNRLEDRSNLAFVESIRKRLEATKQAGNS